MDFKQARRMSRFAQLAVAAARQAIDDAGLEIGDHNRDDIAVVVNTGGGGLEEVAAGQMTLHEKGGNRVSPFMVPMMSPSMAACQISIQNGTRGPVITSVAACASGVQAFVEAQRLIEHGDVDVVIAGGTESAIQPVAFAALANMGALSTRNDDPERASRPFDARSRRLRVRRGGRHPRRRVGGARRGARRADHRRGGRRRPHRRRVPHLRAGPVGLRRDAGHAARGPRRPPRAGAGRPRRGARHLARR